MAELKSIEKGRVFSVVVERGPEKDASVRKVLKTPSRETVLVNDTIQCFNPDKLQQFLDTRLAKKLGVYDLRRMAFPLLEFARCRKNPNRYGPSGRQIRDYIIRADIEEVADHIPQS